MPIVTVEWIEGRTEEQKTQLVEVFTKAIIDITKVSKDHVWIVFRDVKRSDWAIGGKKMSEQ